MSRASNLCQIDNCKKKRQKTTIFCKRHERKIPKKMMDEVRKFFRNYPDGYSVIDFDNLTKKCNFSLKINDYEKRYKHHIKTQTKKLGTQKIYVIAGYARDQSVIMWKQIEKAIDNSGIVNGEDIVTITHDGEDLKKSLKNPCAVILLGEAGVRATMYPGRAENGIIHGGSQAATPEKCFEAAWKDRPSSPRQSYNYYYSAPTISCEPHPGEFEDFGKGEIREITKCLEWAKQFLYKEK